MALAQGRTALVRGSSHVHRKEDGHRQASDPEKDETDEADEYELVSDIVVYQVNGWEGLLDARTGKAITPAVYWTFEMISKDLIRADLGQEDGGVILDRRGRIVRCN